MEKNNTPGPGNSINSAEASVKDLGDLLQNLDDPLKTMRDALKRLANALREPGATIITAVHKPGAREKTIREKWESISG